MGSWMGSCRSFLWRHFYNRLATHDHPFVCMNWGYTDEDDLEFEDPLWRRERFGLQLYRRVLRGLSLDGARLLEVSSGRGGGLAWLVERHPRIRRAVGVDFAAQQVRRCRQRWQHERLEFREGRAEELPLEDGSFDIAISVEASHCYAHREAFVAEVHRVLAPGGVLAWTDLFAKTEAYALLPMLQDQGFGILDFDDITPQVLDASRQDRPRREALIQQHTRSKALQRALRIFAAADEQARTVRKFREKEWKYLWVQARKEGR